MFISDVLKTLDRPVERIHDSRSVLDAIQKLVEKHIGSLLVEDEDRAIIGIITERDILCNSAERSHLLNETLVREVMTRDLILGEPGDTVSEVLALMTRYRVRHMPIMNGSRLAGMVSIGDLVKAQLEEAHLENHHLKDYIQGR